MPDESEGFPPETGKKGTMPDTKPATKAGKFKVRRVTEGDYHPVVFEHEDEGTAKQHVRVNYPRGAEVYLESPDGSKKHYSADLEYQGHSEPWQDWSREN